jgi:phytol kinase
MIPTLIAVAGVAVLVYLGEFIQHRYNYHPEITRKFIHISVATFAATWPLFMSWGEIGSMSILLFVGVLVSKRLSFFHAIHDVKRLTWGEIFFPVSIGFAALLQANTLIYVAAMLHLGIADGMAAVVGTLFGKKHRYKVFGHTKSRAGTITFFVCSFIIVLVCGVLNGPKDGFVTLLLLPPIATLVENVGIAGSDNLLVPILVVLALQ